MSSRVEEKVALRTRREESERRLGGYLALLASLALPEDAGRTAAAFLARRSAPTSPTSK